MAKATVCMFVLAVSLLENAMVVLVVKKNFKRSHMRNANSLFIANISVADIFFAIQNIPHAYNHLVLNGHWILQGSFGTVLCKMDIFFSVITMVTANLTILAIAIYRLCVVYFPFRKIITKKACFFIIFLTWLVPALFASPMFYFADFISNDSITRCNLKNMLVKRISYAGFALILVTTLLAMLVLYAAIGFKVWRRKFPSNASERARELREKRNREIFKMLITLLVAFYTCSLPILTLQLSIALDFFVVFSENPHLRFISLSMLFLNGAINPIIYVVFNRRFRNCVKETLARRYVVNLC
ncbi:RYamide receptor-like [Stylophora pistillata]|uniref:RYamide receptor-like n=1 Tax=Stylophora pistillata TaxID=50429 RepID=UPI000C04005B|nr:RYamide receptor-like [Stylophora pistillata]